MRGWPTPAQPHLTDCIYNDPITKRATFLGKLAVRTSTQTFWGLTTQLPTTLYAGLRAPSPRLHRESASILPHCGLTIPLRHRNSCPVAETPRLRTGSEPRSPAPRAAGAWPACWLSSPQDCLCPSCRMAPLPRGICQPCHHRSPR